MGKGNNAQKKETKKPPKEKAAKSKPSTTSLDKTKK
jgi:hypothetical protein